MYQFRFTERKAPASRARITANRTAGRCPWANRKDACLNPEDLDVKVRALKALEGQTASIFLPAFGSERSELVWCFTPRLMRLNS